MPPSLSWGTPRGSFTLFWLGWSLVPEVTTLPLHPTPPAQGGEGEMTRAGGLEQVTPRASLRRLPACAMLAHTQLPSVWPLEWVGPGGVSEAILPCSPALTLLSARGGTKPQQPKLLQPPTPRPPVPPASC